MDIDRSDPNRSLRTQHLHTSPRALSYYYMITMQHDLIRHLNKILKGADLIVCIQKHI